nr:MAG TPA: hypothetical protein [Caudoviricetes sp.]
MQNKLMSMLQIQEHHLIFHLAVNTTTMLMPIH